MIELIEQINEVGWSNALLYFVLIVCIVVTGVSGYKKALSVLGLRSERTIAEEQFKENINELQTKINSLEQRLSNYQMSVENKQEEYHQQSIGIRNGLADEQNDLKKDIQSLAEMVKKFINDQNNSTIAILRSSLWRLHREFVAQDFVTPDGLKTFMEMGKVYESAGGDDIYHEKLLPEVESLDIHYPDGSIYNHKD